MLPQLPSLRFQPKYYTGGVLRFHLPLLYDLVALGQPAKIVILGFGDGQAHFTFCQAIRENKIEANCLTIRRDRPGENSAEDEAWQRAIAESDEFYHGIATLTAGDPVKLADETAEGSIQLLLLDDCDSYETAHAELSAWQSKLAANAVILFHGLELQRAVPPRKAFDEITGSRALAEFSFGIGLGVVGAQIFESPEDHAELSAFHQSIAARIDAEDHASKTHRKNSALELRQVWLDTMLEDRWKAQQVMDTQARALSELHEDRAKAQLIMDTQAEQLKHWVGKSDALAAENKKLKKQLAQERSVIKNARKACRKHGHCFGDASDGEKRKRSIAERILREIRRIPANLSRAKKTAPAEAKSKPAPEPTIDRYPQWIAEHEPNDAALAEQRRAAEKMASGPTISLLLPTYNPPAEFFDALLDSLGAQTYGKFEICIADGGSDAATKDRLQQWEKKEPRIRVEYLPENLGIAENTNRALASATGDFFACIDQDDLLAPFALYELARAIAARPQAEIFYSDEDRLTSDGRRHSPFFKPEWNPEYLLSSMYLGHLTAYRRDLVERVGSFRKEFDLSQDYDFALRATEQAQEIVHLPHVLYHWREHPASGSAGGKPHARLTNLAALGDAMKRRGLDAEILEYPTANRARMKIAKWPRVSIVIPTDSAERARAAVEKLSETTAYPDYEIVLVTNSVLADALESLAVDKNKFRFVRYDKPFNFSDKSNLGAAAATGTRLIFLNDDVENTEADWVQNLIEPLANPAIGAVAPKLLYETGKIQHAGLVTGVRELVGTACHQWPANSTDHFNFAQSMRAVSALSAACLAMRRDDFFAVGEFDAVNTPVAHSDFDLCFKIREAGMRCVYTPFVTLTHRGHASIGAERAEQKIARKERATIFLLKRWPGYVTRDPYFPENMREWLYADSPTPIQMWAPSQPFARTTNRNLLFVSHDLSLSGAPMMLFHAALWSREQGDFVVVMAPETGPLGEKLQAAEIPLIIDPLVEKEHHSLGNFAREFDCVVANTVRSEAVVRTLARENVPVAFWLHEPASVGEHFIRENAKLRAALPLADLLITPSAWTAAVYRPFNDRAVKYLRNAIPDFAEGKSTEPDRSPHPLRFLLLGSIEPRKGQDLFVQAIELLPPELQKAAQFQIAGRVLDPDFWSKLEPKLTRLQNFSVHGALGHREAMALLAEADVIICASRDEAMPMTILEGMCFSKAIIATTVGGAQEIMRDGENGLLVRPENPAALSAAIRRLIEEPTLALQLGKAARRNYENNFTIDRFGREFRETISELLAKGRVELPAAV